MAGLYFKAGADFENLKRLKSEIDELKGKLQNLDKATDPKGFDKLNAKLHASQGEFDKLATRAAKAGAQIEKTSNDSTDSLSKFEKKLMGLGGLTGFAAIGKELIETRGNFQQLEIAFSTLLQSKSKANELMAQMVETAMHTPFDLQGVAGGARQLLAYGFAADEVNDTLIRLGNVASGMGLPLERLTYLYGTTRTQGRLYARDVLQFTTSGIPLLQKLADMYGVTTGEMNEMVSAGKIGFSDVEKVFKGMTDKGGMFFNLMQEQSKSFTGQISNIKDQIDKIFNEIGISGEGAINSGLALTQKLLNNYEQVGKAVLGLVATYGVYRVAASLVAAGAARMTAAELTHYGVLVVVKKAQDLLNASMLANPYVRAAVLLTGLVATIWALQDADTSAEKAQKSYNAVKEKAAEAEEKHKNKIEELISTATNQALADLDRQKALDVLKNEYPKIFEKYDIEKLKLADILSLKKQIAEEDSRVKEKSNLDLFNSADARVKSIQAKLSSVDSDGRISNKEMVKNSLNRQLEEAIIERSKYEDDVEKDRVAKWTNNLKKLTEVQIKAYIDQRSRMIYEVNKAESNGVKNPVARIVGLGSFNKDELQSQTKTLEAELTRRNQKTYSYVQIQKKYQGELSVLEKEKANLLKMSMPESEFRQKLDDVNARIDVAKKKLKDIGISTPTAKQSETAAEKAKREAQKQADLDTKIASDKIKKGISERQSEIDNQKSILDVQQDGFSKQKQLNDLNHKQRLLDIEKKTQELIEKQQETERQEWEKGDKKATFKPKTLSLEQLPESDKKQIKGLITADTELSTADNDALIRSLKDKYKSFDEKRREIDKQYKDDTAAANGTLGGTELETRLSEIKKTRKDSLKQVNDEEADYVMKTNDLFIRYFGDMSDKSVKDIRKVVDEIKTLYEYLKKTPENEITDQTFGGQKFTSSELKSIKSSPQAMGNIKSQGDSLTQGVDHADKGFAKLKTTIGNVIKLYGDGSIEGKKKWEESIQSLQSDLSTLQTFVSGFTGMLDAIGTDSAKSASKSIGAVMDIAGSTMQGFVQGGPIGAAIAFTTSTLTKVFESEKAHQEALIELHEAKLNTQRAYNLALLDTNSIIEKAQTIFGTDAYGEAIGNLKKYYDSLSAYQKVLNETDVANRRGSSTGRGGTKGYLSNVTVQTGTMKSGLFGWGGEKAVYSNILDQYPKLIDSEGKLNRELAQSILNNDKMSESSKAALQSALDYSEKYEEALQAVRDYYTSVFGDFGDTLISSIMDNLDSSKDALSDFFSDAGDSMKKFIENMAYNIFLATKLDSLQTKIIAITEDQTLSDKDKYTQQMNLIGTFFSGIGDDVKAASDWIKGAQTEAENYGFNFDSSNSSSSGGFDKMSQDSADELNGRFTALQMSGVNMENQLAVISSDQKTIMSEQLKQSDILMQQNQWLEESRNIQLKSVEHLYNISKNTKVLPEMNSKLDKLIGNTENM